MQMSIIRGQDGVDNTALYCLVLLLNMQEPEARFYSTVTKACNWIMTTAPPSRY